MDKNSLTRTSPSPTRAIVADEAFCAQVAAVLMCDEEPIHNVFIGEPVEEVLAMVRWALSHEQDEGFDTAHVLTDWAKKLGRGIWASEPDRPSETKRNPNLELARFLDDFWSRHPEDLAALLDRVQASLNGSAS